MYIYMCVHFVHYLLPTARSSNSNASYEMGGALPLSKDSSMSMEEKGSSFSEEDDKTASAGPRWVEVCVGRGGWGCGCVCVCVCECVWVWRAYVCVIVRMHIWYMSERMQQTHCGGTD